MTKILIAVALVTIGCKGSGKPKPGPTVAWRATIDKDTYDGIAVANGSLITVDKSGVHAIRAGDGAAGAEAWTRKLAAEPTAWLIPLGADHVLVGDDAGTIYALAIDDGAVTWQAITPLADGTDDHPWIKAAAASGDRVVLLDAYMRFLVVDPAACAKADAACMTPSGELASGASAEGLALAPDGTRVVWEFSWVAMFTATGERIASFSADDLFGGVAASPAGIFVTHDQGVARLDPVKCKADGARYALGKREDRDPPPAGCIERIHDGPTEVAAPVAPAGALAWVTGDDEIRGRGNTGWQISMETLHQASELVADRNLAYVACWVEPEGDDIFVTTADLCAVALDTGKVAWRSKLGLGRAGLMDGPWIRVGGGLIFVALSDQVVALPVAT